MNQDCPGCDYVSGRVCDDCLDLIELKLGATDIMAGIFTLLLIVAILLGVAAWLFGAK